MPQLELPPDFDLGFLCLHKDGSVTATFRMTYIFTVRPPIEFTLNLRRGNLFIHWGTSRPVNVYGLFDEDVDAWLPAFQDNNRIKFASTLERAIASNTNTGFRLYRHSGRTMLQAWRSHRKHFLVHVDGIWIAPDDEDAHTLMMALQQATDQDAITF